MSEAVKPLLECNSLWEQTRAEADDMARSEPVLASFVHSTVLNHSKLESALSYHLAHKLGNEDAPAMLVRQIFDEALEKDPSIGDAVRADLQAVRDRDPACRSYAHALLFFKGFLALQSYRIAHWLWRQKRESMALFLQHRMAEVFDVDIHPAATIGRGVMMDHATGIVIGETATLGDGCSLLHGVTLGGTGKETEDRHPKVGRGVLIGAGAKVLGNITVGDFARIAAGSVVLKAVPESCTVAGVPAEVIGCAGCDQPAREMNQLIEDTFRGMDGDGI